MTGRREKFEKLDRTVKGEVKFGNGSLVKIEGKGSIKIVCKNGEARVLQAGSILYTYATKQHHKPGSTVRRRKSSGDEW